MTEIVREWTTNLLNDEINNVEGTIMNERVWANGSCTNEEINMHNENINLQEEYIEVLEFLKEELRLIYESC